MSINPSDGEFTIYSTVSKNELIIYNSFGELVLTKPLVYGDNKLKLSLASGFYLAKTADKKVAKLYIY